MNDKDGERRPPGSQSGRDACLAWRAGELIPSERASDPDCVGPGGAFSHLFGLMKFRSSEFFFLPPSASIRKGANDVIMVPKKERN